MGFRKFLDQYSKQAGVISRVGWFVADCSILLILNLNENYEIVKTMIIIKYSKKHHKKILLAGLQALKAGQVLAYSTDTSYGLGADIKNMKAVAKLYRIKERNFKKPIHVVVPSVAFAEKIAVWGSFAQKLTTKFWPGPLTIVLPLKKKSGIFYKLGGGTGTIGLRFPKNNFALDLAKTLKRPITTTGANPSAKLSGGRDSYSANDVCQQFSKKKFKPDIIIDGGRVTKRKPSTIVKITGQHIDILRIGPISEKQISQALKTK